MVDKKKNEASNLASSRASPRSDKIKSGADAQQEFTRMIKKMFNVIDAQLKVEPKGIRINADTINNMLNKKDKKKLN
jgi:hypothetical protein